MQRVSTIKKKYEKINTICDKYNAKIIKFEYYKRIFGNFIIEIEYNDKIYNIVTDKGDIYLNNQLICDSSYHIAGKDDTIEKILEILNNNIFIAR